MRSVRYGAPLARSDVERGVQHGREVEQAGGLVWPDFDAQEVVVFK